MLGNELVKICSKSIQIWATLEICSTLTRKNKNDVKLNCLGCGLVGGDILTSGVPAEKKSGLYFQMNDVQENVGESFFGESFFSCPYNIS